MSQPVRGRSAAPTIDHMLLVSLLVAVIVIASYLSLLIGGDNVLPAPYNGLVFAIASTGVIAAVTKKVAKDLGQAIDRLDAKLDRRADRINSALIQQGATLAESTGEIPSLRYTASVVEEGEVVDMPSPATVEAMRRIARRITDN